MAIYFFTVIIESVDSISEDGPNMHNVLIIIIMNNFTTSPVAQYCMQIKDKASYIGKGR